MLDPLEAFSFTEETGNGQVIFQGSVEPGVPWAVVDMTNFAVQQPTSWTLDALTEAWDGACAAAQAYWTNTTAPTTAEVLVGGPITLLPQRMLLVPTLRQLGLVQ
jgi:hypothetical protein